MIKKMKVTYEEHKKLQGLILQEAIKSADMDIKSEILG